MQKGYSRPLSVPFLLRNSGNYTMSLKLNIDMSRNKVLLGISLDEVATLQSLIDQHSISVVDLEITSDNKRVIEKRLHQMANGKWQMA